MEVLCSFDTVTNSYRCYVYSCQFPEEFELNFVGNHEEGKTDDDVINIFFCECNFTKIPQGLTKQFPNLETLGIYDSNLKNISRSDLIEYKNLKEIYLASNKIEFLPGDLFEGFENLERIFLQNNNLKIVEPNILDGLENLKIINLNGAVKYEEVSVKSSDFHFDHNAKLIRSALLNKYMENDAQLLKDFVEKLQFKIQVIKKFKTNLIHENIEIFQKCQKLEHENNRLAEENQKLQNVNQNLVVQQENLNHEIQQLKINEKMQAQAKQNQHNYLKLTQRYSDLELALAAEIFKDQQNIQKFCSGIKNFIQDETTKDFQIQIDDHEFPVHKFLLAARSPTLAEILKNNPEVENLNLVDISVEIFEITLKFLYADELPGDNGTNFLHLFAAERITGMIDSENALAIFKIACKYDNKELKLKTFKLLKEKYPGSKFKDEWIDDTEKVDKLIAYLKKMEEMEKSLEDMM